eukprot:scaffold20065_cov60-Phaeocystis_antarctica.AAC.5
MRAGEGESPRSAAPVVTKRSRCGAGGRSVRASTVVIIGLGHRTCRGGAFVLHGCTLVWCIGGLGGEPDHGAYWRSGHLDKAASPFAARAVVESGPRGEYERDEHAQHAKRRGGGHG